MVTAREEILSIIAEMERSGRVDVCPSDVVERLTQREWAYAPSTVATMAKRATCFDPRDGAFPTLNELVSASPGALPKQRLVPTSQVCGGRFVVSLTRRPESTESTSKQSWVAPTC